MKLEFYYDVVCPWAYMASTRLAALEARGVEVVRKPILLGGVFRNLGAPDDPNEAMGPARKAAAARDQLRWAEQLGVPLKLPAHHPRRTVNAMRLILAAPEAGRIAVSDALFRAYWVDGADISDREVLAKVAADHGIDIARIDEPAIKDELHTRTKAASDLGVFGVPTFRILSPAASPDLFWGLDRMELVERALGLEPDPLPRPKGEKVRSFEFFHDFSSPYSYLASTWVGQVAADHGAELVLRPMLLGGLFRDINTPGIPLLAMNPTKQKYGFRDMQDWAKRWGVPFRFPSTFPLRTITPLRVSIAEPRTVPAIYRAAWAENRDIGDEATLAAVLGEAGFDAADLLDRAKDPAVKDALKFNGDLARTIGVFGAPTFRIGDRLVWGQDRREHLEAMLGGWSPEGG